ncbi:MAG: c-type cytochrome [Gemmataceae bacterium]
MLRFTLSLLLLGVMLADWNPVGAAPSRPVVAGYERFHAGEKANLAAGGRLLLGELGCAACHEGGSGKRQAPILDRVGDRVRSSFIRQLLANPHKTKPGTLMPDLLAGDPEKEAKIEALVHLLASTGALQHERPAPKGVGQGFDLYHKVGCVACHGTRTGRGEPDKLLSTSVPMSDLKTKYTIASLATFLQDPLHSRPAGRMPRLLNKAEEARAVATFLLQGVVVPPGGRGSTRYAYYEYHGDRLPDFAKLKPKATGTTAGFDIGVALRNNDYAMKFDAVWKVEREALYTFILSSDDGAKIHVDGKEIVNNDGIHPPTTKEGKIQLAKGVHRISVTYFQGGGEAVLDVLVQATGFGRKSLGDLVAADEANLDKQPALPKDEDTIAIKPELVARGKQVFASLGCASCHQLKIDGKEIVSSLKAPPQAKLEADKGCLAAEPGRGVPRFGLDNQQRRAIAAGLSAKAPEATPQSAIRDTMTVFNCYACHLRDKVGGAQEEVNAFFQTTQKEMGDEGRLPPSLDGVGAKLNPEYFRQLLDRGADDRPYMHTRMPGFGLANTAGIIDHVQALDRLPAIPEVKFTEPMARVKSQARHLVGGLALGCIKCHTFNGVKAEGVQGIDMTLMPRRLKRDWFHAYIADPQSIRPGTRMPASFLKGKSVLPDILDGTALTQIEAIWDYLKDGGNARLPVGMGKASIPLMPFNTAIIYRNFIEGAGARAIAVGYPEKIHLAFDANELRLSLLWQGAFIDAARHWTDRGVGFEGPLGDNLLRMHGGASFSALPSSEAPWPGNSPKKLGHRFKGYRLTPDERPTFLYTVGDVAIEDFPNPVVVGKELTLKRTFTLTTTKPLNDFYYRAAVGDKIESLGDGWYRIDNAWKVKVPADSKVRKPGGKQELIVPIRFQDGKATFVQDYVW